MNMEQNKNRVWRICHMWKTFQFNLMVGCCIVFTTRGYKLHYSKITGRLSYKEKKIPSSYPGFKRASLLFPYTQDLFQRISFQYHQMNRRLVFLFCFHFHFRQTFLCIIPLYITLHSFSFSISLSLQFIFMIFFYSCAFFYYAFC